MSRGGNVFRTTQEPPCKYSRCAGRWQSKIIVYGLSSHDNLPPSPSAAPPNPIREVNAVWRTPNHLDLFASTLAAGAVVSTALGNPRGTPPEFPACPSGWRGWFPVAATTALANAAPGSAQWLGSSRLDLYTTGATGA